MTPRKTSRMFKRQQRVLQNYEGRCECTRWKSSWSSIASIDLAASVVSASCWFPCSMASWLSFARVSKATGQMSEPPKRRQAHRRLWSDECARCTPSRVAALSLICVLAGQGRAELAAPCPVLVASREQRAEAAVPGGNCALQGMLGSC